MAYIPGQLTKKKTGTYTPGQYSTTKFKGFAAEIKTPQFVEEEKKSLLESGKRLGTSILGGTIYSLGGMAGAGEWASKKIGATGIESLFNDVEETLYYAAQKATPEDQNFIEKLGSGVGSAVTYFVPGLGASKGAGFIAKVGGNTTKINKLAKWMQGGTMTLLETASEAGSVYEENQRMGLSDEDASARADKTFYSNLALNAITNKFTFSGKGNSAVTTFLKAAPSEALQEAGQQIISNTFTDQDPMSGVVESALIGGIIGGGMGVANQTFYNKYGRGGVKETIIQELGVTEKEADEITDSVELYLKEQPVSVTQRSEASQNLLNLLSGEKTTTNAKQSTYDMVRKTVTPQKVEVNYQETADAVINSSLKDTRYSEQINTNMNKWKEYLNNNFTIEDLSRAENQIKNGAGTKVKYKGRELEVVAVSNINEDVVFAKDTKTNKTNLYTKSELKIRRKSNVSEAEAKKFLINEAKNGIQYEANKIGALKTSSKKEISQSDKYKSIVSSSRKIPKITQRVKKKARKITVKTKEAIRGLSLGVEEKAVRNKLVDTLGDLPEYEKMNFQEQAKKAEELLKTNPDFAYEIAMGRENPPKGLIPEAVFVAVENKAILDGDVFLVQELGTESGLLKESTEMGQRISYLQERTDNSPAAFIQDLVKTRQKVATKKSKTKDIKALKSEIAKENANEDIVADFINSLEC